LRACNRIEHAKANDDRAYLARKPSYTREQFAKVWGMGQAAVGIAHVAKEAGLSGKRSSRTTRPARKPL